MNTRKCLYCNNLLSNSNYCYKHKNPVRFFYNYENEIFCHQLFTNCLLTKYVEVYPTNLTNDKKYHYIMLIINYEEGVKLRMHIDKNLTPENVEQKIKTYLTFQ